MIVEDHLDDRGFARAVGAQQPEDLVGPDLEIHVVHGPGLGPHPEVPKDLGQAHGLDDDLIRTR
jgi:hypothetical protein